MIKMKTSLRKIIYSLYIVMALIFMLSLIGFFCINRDDIFSSLHDDNNFLLSICLYKYPDMLNYKFKVTGDSLLHDAVLENKIRCIKTLLAFNADIRVKNKNGQTPITYAIINDNLDALRLNLQYGFRIDESCNMKGEIPLIIAARMGSLHAFDHLLYLSNIQKNRSEFWQNIYSIALYNAALCVQCNNDYTQLQKKNIENNYYIIIDKLLNRHANPNKTYGANRDNCLYPAINGNHLSIVQILVLNGAEVNMQNLHGISPLAQSLFLHNFAISEFLESHGARI